MLEEIVKTAKLICACEPAEEAVLERLCAVSERQLRGQLRAGISPEACGEAFICAGAWLAVASLIELRGSGGEELSSLRAGEVTVSLRDEDGGARAASLRRSARVMMEPYTEGGFYFCAVKG